MREPVQGGRDGTGEGVEGQVKPEEVNRELSRDWAGERVVGEKEEPERGEKREIGDWTGEPVEFEG